MLQYLAQTPQQNTDLCLPATRDRFIRTLLFFIHYRLKQRHQLPDKNAPPKSSALPQDKNVTVTVEDRGESAAKLCRPDTEQAGYLPRL
jgi:hypothetical protein